MDIVSEVNTTMSPCGHLGLTNHQGHTYIPFLTDILTLKSTKIDFEISSLLWAHKHFQSQR
jgi:hypothetical protein